MRKKNSTLPSCKSCFLDTQEAMYMMITGPPNPLDSLHPLPGKCAEQIKIRRHYFSKVWRIREFNLRLSLQKKTQRSPCQNPQGSMSQHGSRNAPVRACKFSECSPSCWVLKSCNSWDAKAHPQLHESLFINVPIYGGWLL